MTAACREAAGGVTVWFDAASNAIDLRILKYAGRSTIAALDVFTSKAGKASGDVSSGQDRWLLSGEAPSANVRVPGPAEFGLSHPVAVQSRRPMRPPAFDTHRLLSWPPAFAQGMRAALRWGAGHTGLPVVVVAAIALVVSWHFFRRTLRLTVEVVIAVAALLAATRLGWISW